MYVVSIVTVGTGTAVVGKLGSAIIVGMMAGAAGAVAGQLASIALGLADHFEWREVAAGAIAGGVGAALGAAAKAAQLASKIAEIAANAVIAVAQSALTQGISVACGLQEKFDWRRVAAAGVGAAGQGLGQAMGGSSPFMSNLLGSFVGSVARQQAYFALGGEKAGPKQHDSGYRDSNGRWVSGRDGRNLDASGKVIEQAGKNSMSQEDWITTAADAFGNALGTHINAEIVLSQPDVKAKMATMQAWDAKKFEHSILMGAQPDAAFKQIEDGKRHPWTAMISVFPTAASDFSDPVAHAAGSTFTAWAIRE